MSRMDMERSRFDYARKKLFEALWALVSAGDIDKRLTYAANYLLHLGLQPDSLPEEMREEFEQLRKALTSIPLSSEVAYVPRPISEDDAEKLAHRILEMYARLMSEP